MITIADGDGKDLGSYKFPIVFVQPPANSGSGDAKRDKEEIEAAVF